MKLVASIIPRTVTLAEKKITDSSPTIYKKVKVSHSLISIRSRGGGSTISWAQLMKGGAHPSPFAALSFPNSKKVTIYCRVDRESFPIVAWRSHGVCTVCSNPASDIKFIKISRKLKALNRTILCLVENI